MNSRVFLIREKAVSEMSDVDAKVDRNYRECMENFQQIPKHLHRVTTTPTTLLLFAGFSVPVFNITILYVCNISVHTFIFICTTRLLDLKRQNRFNR